jgi:hypothetical protein
MNRTHGRNAVAVFVLGYLGLAAGCSQTNVDGKYQDLAGAVTVELKDQKASMDIGPVHIDAKYTVDGDKVTIKPDGGPNPDAVVLNISKDGSLVAATPNPLFNKLVKAK